MVVITGEPRSGTSLMMRIVDSLGIEIAGENKSNFEWEGPNYIATAKEERAKYLNPEGFWETKVVSRGIRTEEELEKYKDKAIKIITSGMLRTVEPAIEEIDKVIFCLRNPREIVQSQKKLISNIKVADDKDWKFSPEKMKVNFNRYIVSVGRYILQSNLWSKTLVVDYRELIKNPAEQIKRISEFLEVPYNPESMSIIRKDLYRSIKSPKKSKLANEIYNSVKIKNFSEEVIESIKEFMEKRKLQQTKWLDDTEYGTWVIAGWSLHKSLATNEKLRNTLLQSINERMLPSDCVYYYDLTESDYTIKRVEQLGDLTRSKIKCSEKDEEVTREVCFLCWEQRKMGEKI